MSLDTLGKIEAPVIQAIVDDHQDKFSSALSVAIVGIGQAGGNIADAAKELGFEKVIAINTSLQDLAALKHIPGSHRFHYGESGAGKDVEQGRRHLLANRLPILDFMRSRFGRKVELVLLVAAAGGGTGAGALVSGEDGQSAACRIAREFLEGCDATRKSVGVLLALPEAGDGAGSIANARRVLRDLTAQQEAVAPLIVVENARITRLWPDITIESKWPRTNRFIMGLFQAFLVLAKEAPTSYTFDAMDLWRLLTSGVVTLGMFDLKAVGAADLALGVREGVQNGLMMAGADLSKATQAALLFVAARHALDLVRAADVEYAASALRTMVDSQKTVLHRGVYTTESVDGLRVYTAIGGFAMPEWTGA